MRGALGWRIELRTLWAIMSDTARSTGLFWWWSSFPKIHLATVIQNTGR